MVLLLSVTALPMLLNCSKKIRSTPLLRFLAFIHTYPFDPRKLKEYARDKGIDVKALRLK